uniref:Uncharacterized protein n=1 Tax=Oryza meridionalis TaxID=40149 RepID=A0A0E0CNH6_9ORYZ
MARSPQRCDGVVPDPPRHARCKRPQVDVAGVVAVVATVDDGRDLHRDVERLRPAPRVRRERVQRGARQADAGAPRDDVLLLRLPRPDAELLRGPDGELDAAVGDLHGCTRPDAVWVVGHMVLRGEADGEVEHRVQRGRPASKIRRVVEIEAGNGVDRGRVNRIPGGHSYEVKQPADSEANEQEYDGQCSRHGTSLHHGNRTAGDDGETNGLPATLPSESSSQLACLIRFPRTLEDRYDLVSFMRSFVNV